MAGNGNWRGVKVSENVQCTAIKPKRLSNPLMTLTNCCVIIVTNITFIFKFFELLTSVIIGYRQLPEALIRDSYLL